MHNQMQSVPACSHSTSVYTTCTQWLHHPGFNILDRDHKCLHFVVLFPNLTIHDTFCCLFIFFPLLFSSPCPHKKPRVPWSMLQYQPNRNTTLCVLIHIAKGSPSTSLHHFVDFGIEGSIIP